MALVLALSSASAWATSAFTRLSAAAASARLAACTALRAAARALRREACVTLLALPALLAFAAAVALACAEPVLAVEVALAAAELALAAASSTAASRVALSAATSSARSPRRRLRRSLWSSRRVSAANSAACTSSSCRRPAARAVRSAMSTPAPTRARASVSGLSQELKLSSPPRPLACVSIWAMAALDVLATRVRLSDARPRLAE
mmetsp:Transcript_14664/g.46152  ORF Transcript_14664/g.46152 Transcript_14664/m.46152 type:complete len:206 (+) Transcript_14664:181-798(+)